MVVFWWWRENSAPIAPPPVGLFPPTNSDTSLYSDDLAYRSSAMFVGVRPRKSDQSDAVAATGMLGDETIRSGLPSVHVVFEANTRAGGRSFGSPSGAPLSTHLATFASSSSLSEMSSFIF